jgi:hypothetical protein
MQVIRVGTLTTQLHKVQEEQFLQNHNLKFYRVMRASFYKIMLNMVVRYLWNFYHSLVGAFNVFLVKIQQRAMAVYLAPPNKAA